MPNMSLIAWLAKEAASTTGKSVRVPVRVPGGKEEAAKALHDGPAPASHQAATRYGRVPYVRKA